MPTQRRQPTTEDRQPPPSSIPVAGGAGRTVIRTAALTLTAALAPFQACAGPPEPPREEDLVAAFTRYYVDSDPDRIYAPRFLGIPAIQNPADLWSLQEIISEVRPDFVVETGTAYGGSALFLALALEQVNPAGKLITIDLNPGLEATAAGLDDPLHRAAVRGLIDRRIEIITSDSLDRELLRELSERLQGRRVVVTLDSCHNVNHVQREIEAYAPLVSVGGYLVVQDTIIDERPEWLERYSACPGYDAQGGPGLAVRRFLENTKDFEADRTREKYLLTFHPSGYLKRVR